MKLSIALKLLDRLPTSATDALSVAELVARWPDWEDTQPENRRRVMLRWLRDLDELVDAGQPFVFTTDDNPTRWYRSPAAAAALMPIEAALALMTTGQAYDRVIGKEAGMRVAGVRDALRERLRMDAGGIAQVAAALRILPDGMARLDAQVAPGVMHATIDAIARQRELCFHYVDSRDSASDQVVSPLGLIAKDRARFLVAGDGFRSGVRHFALHRMSQASVGLRPLTRPPGFDLDRHLAELDRPSSRWHELRARRLIDLELRVRADTVREFRELPLGPGQTVSDQPDAQGWHTVTCELPETRQLTAFLLGFGDAVEVLRPAALRAEIGRRVAAVAARYRG